jgi:dihydropteroate synthase
MRTNLPQVLQFRTVSPEKEHEMMKSFSLRLRNRLETFHSPLVMGILNITPDSFFASSRVQDTTDTLRKVETMLLQGADIIDIGGQSTRPGAERISVSEEMSRVVPQIEALVHAFPKAIISVDTFYAEVARASADAGASIINDVSGGSFDENMFTTAANLGAPYVCMHMQGEPQTMQQNPEYNDVVADTIFYLSEKIGMMKKAGIHDIIIDPGFGFGKKPEHNWSIMKHLAEYQILECPILVGISRKKMIQRVVGKSEEEALNGTTAANMLALQGGASILRVHDVMEAKETVAIFNAYNNAK